MKELEWKIQDLKNELDAINKRRKELLKHLKVLEWAIALNAPIKIDNK